MGLLHEIEGAGHELSVPLKDGADVSDQGEVNGQSQRPSRLVPAEHLQPLDIAAIGQEEDGLRRHAQVNRPLA